MALLIVSNVGTSAAEDTQDQAVETVVVTGSRIPQTELTSVSPIAVIDRQEIEFEGATHADALLDALPSTTADQGQFQTGKTTGIATVDLRDLGSQRTLVLIDGKRLMPGDPTEPVSDLNQIPVALVDHVEVLTGGASAVYGSDALAGAVNFITRKNFEGFEIDGTYTASAHDNGNAVARAALGSAAYPVTAPPDAVWDGEDVDTTLLFGATSHDGRSNVVAYAGYRTTSPVRGSQRDYTSCPMQSAAIDGIARTGFICSGSPDSPVGLLFSADGFNGFYRTTDNGDLIPFEEPRDDFNFAPFNYIQRPDERWTAGWFGHYTLSKSAEVYASTMFMDDHTVVQTAPSGWFAGVGPNGGAMAVNCDNPFLGSATDPNSPERLFCVDEGLGPQDDAHLLIGRRLVEASSRQEDFRHTSYRVVTGLKGDLGGNWSYDVSGQYGATLYRQNYLNDDLIAREQNALEVVLVNGVPTCKTALSGHDPECVPANIFQLGQISSAATRYIDADGFQKGKTVEVVFNASLVGDLAQLGMKSPLTQNAVSVALGSEYRDEVLENRVSREFAAGDLAGVGGPKQSVTGRFDVAEGFGELRVPLVEDHPFSELLQLDAGYRYSNYSTAGSLTTYKIGGEWQPVGDVRFRATYQRAARAPNVLELFTPQSFGGWFSGNGGDPCGTDELLTQEQCDRTNGGKHLGSYGTSLLDCPNQSCSNIVGGSTALEPELAVTQSIGAVITPGFLPEFSATVDYFDIKIANVVGVYPQPVVLFACGESGSPLFCNMIHRAPDSGVLYGTSGYIDSLNRNSGFLHSSGVDFEANYETDISRGAGEALGSLSFSFQGTWTNHYVIEPIPHAALKAAGVQPPYSADCAGLFGLVCGTALPAWRQKLRISWDTPWNAEASFQWRHSSSVNLDINTTNPILNSICGGPCGDTSDARIGAYDYFDASLVWKLNARAEIRAGINNMFDADPPVIDSGIVGAPLGYDLLGRTIFIAYTLRK